jgi:hypothetical protein
MTTTTTTTTILYHANCSDGFGAAFVAWLRFGDDAKYIPVQYGQPMPVIEEQCEVYILDFSYPAEELVWLAGTRGVYVIDHHATAKDSLSMDAFKKIYHIESEEDNVAGGEPMIRMLDDWLAVDNTLRIRFDMDKSGAVLAWEYFFPGVDVPDFFLYLQDRDLWQWRLPLSREVNDAIRSYPFDFNVWRCISGMNPNPIPRLQDEGSALRRMTQTIVRQAARNAARAEFSVFANKPAKMEIWVNSAECVPFHETEPSSVFGTEKRHVVPVLNCTAFISETCEELLRIHPEARFVATYFDGKDGKRVWSLRSRPDFDCSVIAKAFGGGGHKQASGFTQ